MTLETPKPRGTGNLLLASVPTPVAPFIPAVPVPTPEVETSCNETFSRVVSGGLGTSEFGAAWQFDDSTDDPPQVAVDGAAASWAAEPAETITRWDWVDVWSSGAELPIEVLWQDLVITWCRDTDNWNVYLLLDSQTDPPVSDHYAWVELVARATAARQLDTQHRHLDVHERGQL